HRPWAVINCAGFASIDAAESESVACQRDNVLLATNLATACAEDDIQFGTFSTDQVFDGSSHRPYVESDTVGPLSVYGRAKHEAEQQIFALGSGALIVRPGALFDPASPDDFILLTIRQLAGPDPLPANAEQLVSPTSLPEFVDAVLNLLIDD